MFHIGIATKHPPLPDPNELSEQGIDFLRQALTLDPNKRPSAADLLNHAWMLDLAKCLEMMNSGEDELIWSNSGSEPLVVSGDELGVIDALDPDLVHPSHSSLLSNNTPGLEILQEVDEAD